MKKDYFNSIDELPIWNWWKIAETSNLIYLHKLEDYEGKKDYNLLSLWNKLNDEYFSEFGLGDNLIQLMTLKKKWIIAKTKFLTTGERFILNEIEEIEIDLKESESSTSNMGNKNAIIFLEEKLHRELDVKNVSVKKYYDYINYYR